ncbi:ribosome-inactivating protein-like [Aegilops tauschii subsp. strangulata]|nr:ribosome-inactivating protein-like [Aegilops tauschii subsp. strangulata]
MGGQAPEFTDSFGVQTDDYGDFIRIVRHHVIDYCSDKRGDGIVQPVLPPEKAVPSSWFHVVLGNTPASSVTLAIRMDNLYLVGFRTPAGVWWEFGKEGGARLIAGSTWLGFGGRYQDLIGQKGLDAVTLGRAQMAAAVDVLAKHGTTNALEEEEEEEGVHADPYAVPKTMLAKLVIMVCEGLRFLTVSGRVDREFDMAEVTITEIEGKQVNKWDRISAAVFKWAVDPTAPFPDLVALDVSNKTDAERIVVLVKDQTTHEE